jgi:hypothetical protein
MLPPNWEQLRQRWEYSHAVGAVLNVIAHSALVLSILVGSVDRPAVHVR